MPGAYPRLSDAQIAALDAQGQRRPIQPGEVLFAGGDRDCGFFVVLAGRVASVERHGTPEERVIAVHGAGRFLGELGLLTGEGAWYSAVALDAGEVRRPGPDVQAHRRRTQRRAHRGGDARSLCSGC
ncbi:MAG: cyclic nucleotide-binding domain-containing protein [Streptosporangiaceae bacterium]